MKVNTLDCTYVKNESVYDNFRRQVEWAIDQLAGYNEVVIQHHFFKTVKIWSITSVYWKLSMKQLFTNTVFLAMISYFQWKAIMS